MFKNFILLAYRHFIRSPLSSFIELFGMTAGLTVFLLILLWVFNETGYDKFNENADRIYRLESNNATENNLAGITSIVAPLLKENLPEVKEIVRFRYFRNNTKVTITNELGEKVEFAAGTRAYTDNSFFDTFSFEFVAGSPETSLTEKNTIVITESLARTIFGNKNAIGEILNERMKITGVIKDVPNFHIPFKVLLPFAEVEQINLNAGLDGLDIWGFPYYPTYLLLPPNHDIGQLEKKITSLLDTHRPDKYKKRRPHLTYHLRPLKDIYFNGNMAKEMGYARHGDRKKVVAYTSIAIFTLLLACINFINLNSAKSFERAKEVGIKKVSGASRANVFFQFLGEVTILCIISMILALIFAHSILPRFNELMNTTLSFVQLFNPWTFISMIIGLILISLASGGFPALYMSSFQPIRVMKGLPVGNTKGFNFKKVNLAIQFAVTIVLLIGSITVFRQINFMKNADLGFDKEHIIGFPFSKDKFGDKVDVMKRTLLTNPNILSVSHNHAAPGVNSIADQESTTLMLNGTEHQLTFAFVDEDYQKTLGLEMAEGRWIEKGRPNDHATNDPDRKYLSIILNQTAVKTLSLENPIGTTLKYPGRGDVKVIGVVKDFHLSSLNNPILPMFFLSVPVRYAMIARIAPTNIASTLQFVNEEVEKVTGQKTNVGFLDDAFNRQYGNEEKFAELIGYFTFLAILIAAMGLLGVSTHAIKLRIKEIGIRKTMGASSFQILILLIQSFVKIIIISAVLAVPIAWVAMDEWLGNYPYRAVQSWWVFGVACGLTVFIAMSTIVWQSWRASSQNPARLIRYE